MRAEVHDQEDVRSDGETVQRGREGPAGGGGRKDAAKIVDACPNAEWRLIFALARYAGLRVPSELFALKWDNVNWTESKMLIHASKTEHHEGKGSRWVPIFPELKPFLTECWESAEPGKVHVISRYRDKNQNLRTQLGRIIRRAGLKTWPKLFQNLRASRATELAGEHPAHVVAAWLGHSTVIANKHYWQVTDVILSGRLRGKSLIYRRKYRRSPLRTRAVLLRQRKTRTRKNAGKTAEVYTSPQQSMRTNGG